MAEKGSYKTIKLPKALIDKVDEFLKTHPEYVSRTDVLKEAIRMHIRETEK